MDSSGIFRNIHVFTYTHTITIIEKRYYEFDGL